MTDVDIPDPVGAAGRATVADVARLAGVSIKTASRALNNSPNVKPSTRARVLQASGALRFRPNAMARELRQGRPATAVAFVMGDLTNPFYSQVAMGVSAATAERGFTLVMAASGDEESRERPTVDSMLERRVSALLLVPIADDHSYLEGERQLGTPIVAVDRPLSNAASDSVVFDNRGGARSATLALADAGCTRIGFVGSSSHLYTHRERRLGYHDALVIRGLEQDETLVSDDAATIEAADAATTRLLRLPSPPDAIFAGNNRATFGAFRAIQREGGATALIGFDDFELAEPLGVTVVSHSPQEMGRMAATLALRRIDSLDGGLEQIVLPTQLTLRRSHLGFPRV
ncbi:LacI family DNA-binding transcriptional regulator [Rathayibacter sp. VKM Ac-2754]|uniref:LacI family DNA-binding transcriptional regulator n=1 Tax=Rathayibacter sp. VKM Ac-2754 TaxID=2609251 RepID=UPI0013589014|nr:LacI family DNA-binding transcriptional regulator [Rathayibacter sp. VKM Ac-2754]MWV60111.1 substrate-binding domain-containing protein [Rathayibacter sp. VKM Ac-2754]